MATYAHINNGVVVEPPFTTPAGFTISECFHADMTWVECGGTPGVAAGWTATQGEGGAWTFAAPVVAPAAPQTTIAPEDFINRFSAAEQQAVITAGQSTWQIQLWLTKALAVSTLDVTAAATKAGMDALVAANILTAGRAAQILNLSVASP